MKQEKIDALISEIRAIQDEIDRLKEKRNNLTKKLPRLWYAYQDMPNILIVAKTQKECADYLTSIGMNVLNDQQFVSPSGRYKWEQNRTVDGWIYSASPIDKVYLELQRWLALKAVDKISDMD